LIKTGKPETMRVYSICQRRCDQTLDGSTVAMDTFGYQ